MYLNSKAYALQHGLAFGGTTEQFRILIPETFEGCTAGNSCLTYESGPLATTSTFEIETVEVNPYSLLTGNPRAPALLTAADLGDELLYQVWGCGGKEVVDRALAAQGKTREDTAAAIRRARTVSNALARLKIKEKRKRD